MPNLIPGQSTSPVSYTQLRSYTWHDHDTLHHWPHDTTGPISQATNCCIPMMPNLIPGQSTSPVSYTQLRSYTWHDHDTLHHWPHDTTGQISQHNQLYTTDTKSSSSTRVGPAQVVNHKLENVAPNKIEVYPVFTISTCPILLIKIEKNLLSSEGGINLLPM